MVRTADLAPEDRELYQRMQVPAFEDATPWTPLRDIRAARVAIISTAGLHQRSDTRFLVGDADYRFSAEYRVIPAGVDYADLLMSQRSVNFDRSAFQQDVESIFPLGHLQKLADEGEIGSVAGWHYSFNGSQQFAGKNDRLREVCRDVGRLLKQDGVTAAVLIPV
jgi:D-proline reductase (dithiol) PrdB